DQTLQGLLDGFGFAGLPRAGAQHGSDRRGQQPGADELISSSENPQFSPFHQVFPRSLPALRPGRNPPPAKQEPGTAAASRAGRRLVVSRTLRSGAGPAPVRAPPARTGT